MHETIEQMHRIFPYISDRKNEMGLFRPMINFVDNAEPFSIGDISLERLEVEHSFPCCGYMIGAPSGRRLAYISDCHVLPERTLDKLSGVDVLVLNCLRERPHPTHLNLESSLAYINAIAPAKTYLIHMCHDLSHEEWLCRLPYGVEPAFDGLVLDL
jgi:phosphoribosyl 1,2-cyclic phosphate phosphodiesterase